MAERHVWIGHAFLAGGMESESEERLSMIGGSPYIDAHLFKDFSYVALGHLHQPQRVAYDHIRYSGSILKYSFSEVHHQKSVTIIDLQEENDLTFEKKPLYPLRDFEIVEGYFEDLLSGEAATSPHNYLHIRLLDDGQLIDPMGKLRKVYPNILHLERRRSSVNTQIDELNKVKERQRLSHEELFRSFYEDIKGDTISEHRKNLISQAIDALKEEERGQ